jgi:hypothetical protein
MYTRTVRRACWLVGLVAVIAPIVLGDVTGATVSAETDYVSGGFAAEGGGGLGTIGYGWVDPYGSVIGHITVDHLTRGADAVTYSPSDNFSPPPNATMEVLQSTDDVDVGLIAAAADTLQPVIELDDGTRLTVTGYAHPGDVAVGQPVCHSGHNETTETLHEVCGTVTTVGRTSQCTANNGASTCVVSFVSDRDDGWPGGEGDSGAAVYTYKPDGTVDVVGTFKSSSTDTGDFEPTYAAMEVFGGQPLTTTD